MKAVLAFSGGLDTSFCVPYLQEKHGAKVITVTVDVGGASQQELGKAAETAKKLGAKKHYTLDCKQEFFDSFIAMAIKANALFQGKYPLLCPLDRFLIAKKVSEIAIKEGADTVAHGCTGAGSDQVRLDLAFQALVPQLKIIAPIRDAGLLREDEAKYLKSKGFKVSPKTTEFSLTTNMFGKTVYSKSLQDNSWNEIPEDAWQEVVPVEKTPDNPEFIEITFEKGIPTGLNGKEMNGPELCEKVASIAAKHGFGKTEYIGDVVVGIKGRIGIEAPAAFALIKAHKALEQLTLTWEQKKQKQLLEPLWSNAVYSGKYFDQATKDLNAFMDSTQDFVTGTVKLKLFKGNASVVASKSPYQLLSTSTAKYGTKTAFTGAQVKDFIELWGLQQKTASLKHGGIK